ncbi:DUF1772 domain-containing protein [Nocardia farcinica]|uniref:DUF1772 domain-containing protein n=1 Tax=Nocardia farcinica TaxID=37329 RepID=UPI001894D4FB|nr:DUF1772 domain-containing protein [Nocardia farcinica]MBF6290573.1 DUF1772 domain-containing protein [Nocardia farcinica]MBF6377746.1 DUF1772 domain-containing protein [Nocardia farcinica]MBF6419743.1 DUF1772 domain-containing protein [Nocardia farcinica]MBF6431220.1 DUF1772 domain-containing protein [Nocardia farcinica]MBF6501734.1 DUF1772 domain-containing protein [Nocardia farcinica]
MITVVQVLAVLALAANAVVYGTDAAAALVVRSANTHLDDTAMTLSAGWGHYYADRRMPPVGITGLVSMLAAAVAAALGGHTAAAAAAGVSVIALIAWLVLYARIAKPVNIAQKAAALSGIIPANARALQQRWDSIIGVRVGLQAIALLAAAVTIAAV